jgi:hypothetical protein
LRSEHRARTSASRSDARGRRRARVRDRVVDLAIGRVHTWFSFRLLYYASSIDPEDAARRDAAPSTTRTSRRRRRELMASGETTKTLVMRQTQEAVGKSASRVGARRTNEGWENSTVRVPENE